MRFDDDDHYYHPNAGRYRLNIIIRPGSTDPLPSTGERVFSYLRQKAETKDEVMAGESPEAKHRLCVLKFGSSVLETEADYRTAAQEVYRHIRDGEKIVAVVSALAGETDFLLCLLYTSPSPRD